MKLVLQQRGGRGGFTLVELLTAVAVLALVVVVVAQMLSKTQSIIVLSRKQLDVDDQARLVFARMATDFAGMVQRTDSDIIFAKQAGNDRMYFFSKSVGDTTTVAGAYAYAGTENTVSLIGYGVGPDPVTSGTTTGVNASYNDFQRLGRGLNWFGYSTAGDYNNMVFLAASPSTTGWWNTLTTIDGHWGPSSSYTPKYNSTGSPPTYLTPPATGTEDPDWHALADQVFRFEYCFLLKDGSYAEYPCEANPANVISTATSFVSYAGPPGTNDNYAGTGQTSNVIGTGTRWFDTNGGRAYICTNAGSAAAPAAAWQGLGLRDVSAIIVAIALLDRNNRNLIASIKGTGWAAKYNALSANTMFVDSGLTTSGSAKGIVWTNSPVNPSNPGAATLMEQNWSTLIANQSTFVGDVTTATGVANATATQIASHITVYQRYFYLNSASPL